MPVSADLLKVLAEDPKSLEQQLGCMTGLFQIFDRQGLGRRYGSKRVSNAGSGQSQPTSACETPRHDRSNNPYWMFEEDSSQRMFGDSFERPKSGVAMESAREHHHRAYSDSSEIFTKSFETPTGSRTSPDAKSQLDQSPMYSEESVGGLAFYYNDPARESCTVNSVTSSYASFEHQEQNAECKKLIVVVPARANSSSKEHPPQSSSDIRDIVRASFDRDQRPRADFSSAKEKPRLSVDGSHSHSHGQQQGYLKNLPRSASVDGKDRLRLSVDGRLDTGAPRQQPADLPRSSSVGGRGASRMLADWKDGLRNSAGSPRLTIKEKDLLKQNNTELARNSVDHRSLAKYQNSAEGRDATRLTVELKEGPRLSVSVDDRRASVDGKLSPRPISRFRETCELPSLPTDFKESLRAADMKEFLRGSQKPGREGHRFSVDGTRDAPRPCIAPRLSVDGRDAANSSALVARKLKLDQMGSKEGHEDSQFNRQSSGRGNPEGDVRRKAANVVARLMGLDELPSSKEQALPAKAVPGEARLKETEFLSFHQGGSPPPPPSPPDDYDYAHRSSDHEGLHHWQKQAAGGRRRGNECLHDQLSFHHQHFQHEMVPSIALQQQQLEPPSNEIPSQDQTVSDLKQSAEDDRSYICKPQSDHHLDQKDQPQQVRKSPQGRRSLWHIFEAMQLKGLLNGSSRRKQAEALKLQKMNEEKECQEIKSRSQSLPPRLRPASKDYSGLEYQDTHKVPLSHGIAYQPRALEPKGSGLEHAHAQTATSEADAESQVMVKPIITRSMSYKSPAPPEAAPSQPSAIVSGKTDGAGKYNPDEDHSPKDVIRGLSKNVVYHRLTVNEMPAEPSQAAESSYSHTTSSSSTLRQSRKERGAARMTKSFSEAPQGERDSSPRGSRALTLNAQDNKPARSCSPRGDSTSVSPRCPGTPDGMRLVDAGKVRRKPFAVKDREESKASLANLRANATKQEFLKGRASGDPDTPRLRRSSSESKLLSKIAEKPIVTDILATKAPAGGGRSAAPTMTLLRPKRPVSKDNKSPMKPRLTSALALKSVANAKPSPAKETVAIENLQPSHVNRPKPVSHSVPESASLIAQEQQIAESTPEVQASARCSMSEVRATHGGAFDHSGDRTQSHATEHVKPQHKAREKKSIEIDDGVKTPRGVSIKKIVFSEDAQAEVAEQPSPVSVLDNSHFDEELTPSPKVGKSSAICLEEQTLRSEKDRRWNSARFLDLDLEESSSGALVKTPESVKDSDPDTATVDTDASTLENHELTLQTKASSHRIRVPICLKDAEEERTYVEDIIQASELGSGCASSEYFTSSTIDPRLFDQLETKRRCFEFLHDAPESDEKHTLDRRILFDCVHDVLARLLVPQVRWTGVFQPSLRKRFPLGRELVQEVLSELEEMPCVASEDVCDTVYVILQKDLVRGRGQQWSEYNKELEEVGLAVERMIVKDLIDETVRELSGCVGQNPLAGVESSRRQLFA